MAALNCRGKNIFGLASHGSMQEGMHRVNAGHFLSLASNEQHRIKPVAGFKALG